MKRDEIDPASNAEARARLARAMELVEEAQHTLYKAAQEISGVIGLADANAKCATLGGKAHDLWKWLAYSDRDGKRSQRMHMDSMHTVDPNNAATGATLALEQVKQNERVLNRAIRKCGLAAQFGLKPCKHEAVNTVDEQAPSARGDREPAWQRFHRCDECGVEMEMRETRDGEMYFVVKGSL